MEGLCCFCQRITIELLLSNSCELIQPHYDSLCDVTSPPLPAMYMSPSAPATSDKLLLNSHSGEKSVTYGLMYVN